MGRPLWAGPSWARPSCAGPSWAEASLSRFSWATGPYGSALMGRTFVDALGPYGLGRYVPLLALMGRALVFRDTIAPPGPLRAAPGSPQSRDMGARYPPVLPDALLPYKYE